MPTDRLKERVIAHVARGLTRRFDALRDVRVLELNFFVSFGLAVRGKVQFLVSTHSSFLDDRVAW